MREYATTIRARRCLTRCYLQINDDQTFQFRDIEALERPLNFRTVFARIERNSRDIERVGGEEEEEEKKGEEVNEIPIV